MTEKVTKIDKDTVSIERTDIIRDRIPMKRQQVTDEINALHLRLAELNGYLDVMDSVTP